MECGGKRSATPLWYWRTALSKPKRRRCALPAHSKWRYLQDAPSLTRLSKTSFHRLNTSLRLFLWLTLAQAIRQTGVVGVFSKNPASLLLVEFSQDHLRRRRRPKVWRCLLLTVN